MDAAGCSRASFGFAAGAMISLVLIELVPQAFSRILGASLGTLAGAGAMALLAASFAI